MISYEGRNRETVNFLKTIYFDNPEWTGCIMSLMPATWMKYRQDLEEVVLTHPRIFPGYRKGSKDFDQVDYALYELGRHTDCWGTVWESVERGLDSMAVGFPLKDWSAFEDYVPPDPLTDDMFGPRDWEAVKRSMDQARREGGLATGAPLQHGGTYMRLFYLRTFENLMVDLATDEPRLWRLIEMVNSHNLAAVEKTLSLGAEYMAFGDDLGLQRSLPMSPDMWRRFIKPSFDLIFRPCREADVPILLHTDGHILEIIPDLIEVGACLLNPQIRANGLEGLIRMAKGKVPLLQDLDRQLFPFATPSQIEEHIGQVHEGLHMAEGGLILSAEAEPDVSLENIDAICTALENICNPPEPEKP